MTPERFARLKQVLRQRQPDLSVIVEGVRKGHNLSAILRTCDAVGVLRAHAVVAPGRKPRLRRDASSGAGKWVRVRWHDSAEAIVPRLRSRGYQIVAAHPGTDARDFREIDYTRPTAVVLGAELDGISDYSAAAADALIRIPMHGLAESLNVSVAAAVVLYEAERQRRLAGQYDRSALDHTEFGRYLFEWSYPTLAHRLREARLAYPPLRDDGSIAALPARSPDHPSPRAPEPGSHPEP
jgi:tRNA (guanosine-2'-O-)-methyltransferase